MFQLIITSLVGLIAAAAADDEQSEVFHQFCCCSSRQHPLGWLLVFIAVIVCDSGARCGFYDILLWKRLKQTTLEIRCPVTVTIELFFVNQSSYSCISKFD